MIANETAYTGKHIHTHTHTHNGTLNKQQHASAGYVHTALVVSLAIKLHITAIFKTGVRRNTYCGAPSLHADIEKIK